MSRIKLGQAGFCYLLGNETLPGLLKIGATTDTPANRAKQLSASTGVAKPFVVLYSRAVPDVNEAEAQMHAAFADRRVNEGREFFSVSLYEAARTLDSLCIDTFSRLDPPTPFSELFASFPDDGEARDLTESERKACRRLEARLS